MDATTLGDRLTVLAAAVVSRGCAAPVAWAALPGNAPGAWHPHGVALRTRVRDALGPGGQAVVLTDRGRESPALFRAIVGLGMHPRKRVKAGGTFRPAGWAEPHPLAGFVRRAGDRFAAVGTAYAGARLGCTLRACRVAGCADPWLVLTDLPPAAADPCGYALRRWAEQGFRVPKPGGWDWQKTRMTDPGRASRMWVARAVATAWPVEVGGLAEFEPRPETIPRFRAATGRRSHRVFRVGRGPIVAGLLAGEVVAGRRVPEPWPEPVPIPPVTEDELLKRPTYPS